LRAALHVRMESTGLMGPSVLYFKVF